MTSNVTLAKSKLWVELYRPTTIEEIILPKRIKDKFTGGMIIQNYLFKGTAGTGKSTLAKIIAREYNALWINASINNSIDTIRNELDSFCSLQSIDGDGIKLAVLDESDLLSASAQGGLRGLIEQYSEHVRFIFTCNHEEKLIDALKSRLEPIDFDFSSKEEAAEQTQNYVQRIVQIGDANGMQFDRGSLQHLFKSYYPDLRSMITRIQGLYQSGVMMVTEKDVAHSIVLKNEELFKFLCTKPTPPIIYTMVSTYKGNEQNVLKDLSTNFISYISAKPEYVNKIGELAIKIHKYGVESRSSIDIFVSLLALCTEISQTL